MQARFAGVVGIDIHPRADPFQTTQDTGAHTHGVFTDAAGEGGLQS